MPTGAPPGRYRVLLGNRPYLRVLSAGLGSVMGSSISTVCLVWIVYEGTRSALDVGALATSFVVASIAFSVFGGTWVDRFDRRRLMIGADLARAAALTIVVVTLLLGGLNLPVLFAANFVVGAFTTVFSPAEQSLLPALVPPAQIPDANGLVSSSRSALRFVGASIAGGFIVTVGATAGVALNALTFLVSAALLVGLSVPETRRARPAARSRSYLKDVRDGFGWLWKARGFFQLTVSATFFNFCSSLIGTFAVVFATLVLHGNALVFAFLLAAEVVGAGLGSLLVGPTHALRRAGRAWVVPYGAASGAVAILLAFFPSVPLALAAFFAFGLLAGYAGTAWLTAAQLLVPTEMQGRYFGVDNLGSIAILPLAQIGGALLISGVGVGAAYQAVAVFWLLSGLAFLVPRSLWNLGYPGVGGRDPYREATSLETE